MRVRLTVKAASRATRVSGQDPPLDITINLTIEDAKRGDAVTGAIEKSLAAATRTVRDVLETRRY